MVLFGLRMALARRSIRRNYLKFVRIRYRRQLEYLSASECHEIWRGAYLG
jgi:hypothetical protein